MDSSNEARIESLLRHGSSLESSLSLSPLSADVISKECRYRLLKAIKKENEFLKNLSSGALIATESRLSSSNLPHLEAILRALHHPSIFRVSKIMHTIKISNGNGNGNVNDNGNGNCNGNNGERNVMEDFSSNTSYRRQQGLNLSSVSTSISTFPKSITFCKNPETVHVDAICFFEGWPSWLMVFSRYLKALSSDRKEREKERQKEREKEMETRKVKEEEKEEEEEKEMETEKEEKEEKEEEKEEEEKEKGKAKEKEKERGKDRSLETRVKQLIKAASAVKGGSKPQKFVIYFASGISEEGEEEMRKAFGAKRIFDFKGTDRRDEGKGKGGEGKEEGVLYSAKASLMKSEEREERGEVRWEVRSERGQEGRREGNNGERLQEASEVERENGTAKEGGEKRREGRESRREGRLKGKDGKSKESLSEQIGCTEGMNEYLFREGVGEEGEWLFLDCVPLRKSGNKEKEAEKEKEKEEDEVRETCVEQLLKKWKIDSEFEVWLEIPLNLDISETFKEGFGTFLENPNPNLNLIDSKVQNTSSPTLVKREMVSEIEINDGTFGEIGSVNNIINSGFTNLNFINLDTTALIAMVSELSNGASLSVMNMSREEIQYRFGSMANFIQEQAKSELEKPLLPEIKALLVEKKPIICQSVFLEFSNIVNLVGGPMEKQRATACLARVRVVPDQPSERILALPETGRIKMRHKIMAGTGDTWHIPTLTANVAFVRAASQAGVPLAVVEHRPRALTGEKLGKLRKKEG